MRSQSKAPSPDVLGQVGEDHLRRCFNRWFGVTRWWYRRIPGLAGDIPFSVEVALAETRRTGRLFTGINFSPTFGDPFSDALLKAHIDGNELASYGVNSLLGRCHAHPVPQSDEDMALPNFAVAAHLVCPALEFLDKGKTRLKVPPPIGIAVGKAVAAVAKDVYQEEERRRKDANRQRRAEVRAANAGKDGPSLKAAVFQVMQEAWDRATGGGAYPTSSRWLYYPVRDLIQPHTPEELEYGYFSQTLVPAYKREVGPLKGLYYDPRGVLFEPHTGRAVQLGTREVEEYHFPEWLFDKCLYVEKKGIWPIMQAAKLAERYDMAVIAGEGYATEACRVLFQNADKAHAYQLFVIHDADPFGYNIYRTLQEETARMPGYSVQVSDLGLHIGDAMKRGLKTETFTRKKALPQGLTLDDQETKLFTGVQKTFGKNPTFLAQRIEMNALTAPGLIAYIEEKLEEAGVRGKVIPPERTIIDTFRSEVRVKPHERITREVLTKANIDHQVEQILERQQADLGSAESELVGGIEQALEEVPEIPWRRPVSNAAAEFVDKWPGADRE
jgi:hypothetical protein